MAHFGVVPEAVACAGTVGTVLMDRTNTLTAVGTGPPVRTAALPVGRITGCPVLAAARLGAVDAVLAVRAGIETLGPHKPGRADTLSRHAITVGPVEAFAPFGAPQPVQTRLAAVRADRARVPGRTNTLTRHRIARSTVLAAALRLTLSSMRSRGT